MLKSDVIMTLLSGILIRSSRRIGRRCMHMCGRRGACTPTSILQLASTLPSLPSLGLTSHLSGASTHPSRANDNLKYFSGTLRTIHGSATPVHPAFRNGLLTFTALCSSNIELHEGVNVCRRLQHWARPRCSSILPSFAQPPRCTPSTLPALMCHICVRDYTTQKLIRPRMVLELCRRYA